MSQEKVDRYKKEKANRKQIMKREKLSSQSEKAGGCILCAAILFWAGYSVYNYTKNSGTDPVETVTTEVDLNPIYDYYATLQ